MNAPGADADRLSVDAATGTEVHLPLAGLGARSFAFVIDLHVRGAVALVWWLVAGMLVTGSTNPLRMDPGPAVERFYWLAVLPAVALWLLYHPLFEIAMHGRTPGKRWAGVRIVALGGAPPSAMQILVRNAFRVLDSLPFAYCVGIIACLFTRRQVRVGDLAAGTLLVYADDRKLEDEFRATKLAHPDEGAIVADLVARWPRLEREQRLALGRRLLARLGVQEVDALDEGDVLARLRERTHD